MWGLRLDDNDGVEKRCEQLKSKQHGSKQTTTKRRERKQQQNQANLSMQSKKEHAKNLKCIQRLRVPESRF